MRWVKSKVKINGRIYNGEIPIPKKRMQFSQKVCVFGLIIVTLAWLSNFILLWNGREPMSDVVIAIITTFGGFTTGGYFSLSGVRDCSLNKLKAKLGDYESEN